MALCPISGEIMEEPVCINGIHYDRANLIQFIKDQIKNPTDDELAQTLKEL